MNIILIEDDAKTADFIVRGLIQEGFSVAHCADGREGMARLINEDFDLAVLDIMLPSLDGFAIIEAVRQAGRKLPIIVLSARDGLPDKLRGLRSGCDDYLTKPFAFAELSARIQALLRRQPAAGATTVLQVADLTLDVVSRRVTRGGERIELQPQEFMLLEYLMRNTGRVVSKTMIVEHVWEYNFDPQTNIVETRMCRLREKIDKPFERKLIQTVRGFGYVLE